MQAVAVVPTLLGEDVLAFRRPAAFERGQERACLHIRVRLAAGEFQDGRSQVEPLDQVVDPPAAGKPFGDQTMHGTRVIASYMVHFWMWPWSPRQSPWSEVKITTQFSA